MSTLKRASAALLTSTILTGLASAQEVSEFDGSFLLASVHDSIVVIGSKEDAARVAGSARYISEFELEKYEYQDVNRILRQVPGVNIQEEDGFGLRPNIGLRGTGLDRSSKVAILEDGVLAAPAPYAAPSAYYFPVAGRMQALEIVKGAAAIKYGPLTTGGAVNLFSTAIPEEKTVRLTTRFGSDEYFSANAVLGNTFDAGGMDIGVLLENYHAQSEGFKELDGGGATGFDVDDFVAKVALSSKAGADMPQRLEFKIQYSDEVSDETYLGLTSDDYDTDPYRRYRGSQLDVMDNEHNTYQINHTIDLTPNWMLSTVIYRNQFQRNWYKLDKVYDGVSDVSISSVLSDPVTYADAYDAIVGASAFVSPDDALSVKNNNREYFSQGIQTVLTHEAQYGLAEHKVELSVRYHEDEEDRYQWVDKFRMDMGDMVLTTAGTPGTESNRISSAEAWSLFVRDEITVGDLTIVPGLRYESIDLRREDFGKTDPDRTGASLTINTHSVDVVIPGIGFTYQVTDEMMLLGGVHKGFTNPSPGSTSDAEESVNYEIGVRYASDIFTASAIGFFNDYSNLVGTCTASTGGGCTIGDQFDGGEVDVKGFELTSEIDLMSGARVHVPLTLGYTYTQAEFQNAFSSGYEPWGSVMAGDEMPYIPEHQINLSIGIEADRWHTNVTLNHVSKARASAGQGTIIDGDDIESRLLVDASAGVQVSDQVEVFVSAENLFDETYLVSYSPAGQRPGKPQTFFAGLRVNF